MNLSRLLLNQHLGKDVNHVSKHVLCSLLFTLSFWVCCVIVTISVKSELVLINTSDVENANLQHMIDTGRRPCWLKNEAYVNWFSKAKSPSIFAKFWEFGNKDSCDYDKRAGGFFKVLNRFTKSCGVMELVIGYVKFFIEIQINLSIVRFYTGRWY